ncbi:MAG: ATP-binding protein [Nautiliaceae bacterium]
MNKNIFEQYLDIINKTLIISETDLNGIITAVNKNFEKISKYSAKELIGKNHNIVRHPDMPKKVFENLWNTIKAGKIWEGIIKNKRKDGKSYYVKSIIAPIKNEKGENIYYVAFRQDITDLVNISNKLSLEKKLLRAILDNTNNIVIVKRNDEFFLVNKKFFEVLPFKTLKEFEEKHKSINELFLKECFYDEDINWYQNKKNIKVCIKDKNNEIRYFNLNINNFKFQNDKYVVFTLTDITDLEKTKNKLIEEQKLKEMFFANMSHEIRTPLNSILGFTCLLEKTELNDQQKEYLSYLKHSSEFLLNIVNEILDFSKIEAGKLKLDIQENNIYETIISTFNSLKPIAKKKNLKFTLKIEPIKECYFFDKTRLKQILTNLLNNAIKFTNKGEVKLIVKKDLTFKVKDTGVGIPKNKINTIFEAFNQTDLTKNISGTGLGLTITKKLIELMGGEIKVKSEVNKGSEFYFKLPLKECKKKYLKEKVPQIYTEDKEIEKFLKHFEIEITPKAPVKIEVLKNKIVINKFEIEKDKNYLYEIYHYLYLDKETKIEKENLNAYILIAEDNEFNRILLKDLLKNFNLNIDFAIDGYEAVQKALDNNYDLILMDVNMPNMDGITAAKKIKKYKSTPIVALTAHTFKEEVNKIKEVMDDYIPKPVKLDNLKNIFQKHLFKKNILNSIAKEYNLSHYEIKNLFTTFIKNTKKLLKGNDYYSIFHQIKSSSGALKLFKIEEIAKKAMKAARDNKEFDFEKIKKEIKTELKKIEDQIKER